MRCRQRREFGLEMHRVFETWVSSSYWAMGIHESRCFILFLKQGAACFMEFNERWLCAFHP
jgi:hypothetical protein